MDDFQKPRDLRKEACKPAPDSSDIEQFTAWMNYQMRWQEARDYEPEEFAYNWLTVDEPRTSTGHKLWLPFGESEQDLAALVEIAKTNRDAHEYLRSWLAGDMFERDVPERLPAALTPFVTRLAKGEKPDNRGKGKTTTARNSRLRRLAEELKKRYGLAIYRGDGNHANTTCIPIAAAISKLECKETTPDQVYEVLRKGGGK